MQTTNQQTARQIHQARTDQALAAAHEAISARDNGKALTEAQAIAALVSDGVVEVSYPAGVAYCLDTRTQMRAMLTPYAMRNGSVGWTTLSNRTGFSSAGLEAFIEEFVAARQIGEAA